MTKETSTEPVKPHPIEIDLFSKQSNKTTKLINSSDGFSVQGAHKWYEYQLNQAVFLTELRIENSGYGDWDKFEVEIHHIDGTKHTESLPVDENVSLLTMGKLVSGFKFRPPAKWSTKTEILRVVATGLTLEEFHEYEWALKDLQKRTEKLAEKERVLAEKLDDETALTASLKSLTSEVGKLTAQREEISKSVEKQSEQLKRNEAVKKDVQTEIESLQEERRGIRAQIAQDTTDLDRLTKKLRLFPAELSELVREGSRNIRNYFILGLPFAIILFVILCAIFSNSIDLTQLWRREADIDVWTIFLTRIPFVLVAIALVETCGFVVGRLIFEVIKINRQRLDFSKLSIVAKDVVTSASYETEMTEQERYEEELKLRMALLQEHMKSQTEEEYRYSGSAISSAIINVANKLVGKKIADK